MFFFLLFLFGLIIGSFLNVLVFRYDIEGALFDFKKLSGRSRCAHCKQQLKWYELIPLLSFLIQKGKCRVCRASLSLQYPLVEFASGLLCMFVPLFLTSFYGIRIDLFGVGEVAFWYYLLTFLWTLVFLVLLTIVVIDIRHYIIPDELNIALLVLGCGITALTLSHLSLLPSFRFSFLAHYALLFPLSGSVIVSHLIALGMGVLVFGGLSVLSGGRAMGFGDVKLASATAFLFGWPDMTLIIILSFIIGGLTGIYALVRYGKTMKDKLPFAPFFVCAIFLVFFFAPQIIGGYFALFGA